jgi:hypothetical protein
MAGLFRGSYGHQGDHEKDVYPRDDRPGTRYDHQLVAKSRSQSQRKKFSSLKKSELTDYEKKKEEIQ